MVPHLRLPLQLAPDGTFVTLEQDSVEEVGQCVEVLLNTELGTRIENPAYGCYRGDFETDPETAQMLDEVRVWEPRAETSFTATPDSFDQTVRHIAVKVGLITNG